MFEASRVSLILQIKFSNYSGTRGTRGIRIMWGWSRLAIRFRREDLVGFLISLCDSASSSPTEHNWCISCSANQGVSNSFSHKSFQKDPHFVNKLNHLTEDSALAMLSYKKPFERCKNKNMKTQNSSHQKAQHVISLAPNRICNILFT